MVERRGVDLDEEFVRFGRWSGHFFEVEGVVDLAGFAVDFGDGDGFGHGRLRLRN